jgi:hypothetical protein
MTTSQVTSRAADRLAARSFAIDGDLDLLDAFDADGFAWIDGDHGFVASGVAAVVPPEHAVATLASIAHRAVADDGRKSRGHRENVTRHRSILLCLQGVNAGRVAAISGSRVRGTIIGARDAAQIQAGRSVGIDG